MKLPEDAGVGVGVRLPRPRSLAWLVLLALASCATYAHRGPPAVSPKATPDGIVDLGVSGPDGPPEGPEGDNPVVATLAHRSVRAGDLGRFIFQTHRTEAMAALSKLIGRHIAEEEARRIGLVCPPDHLESFKRQVRDELAREAALTFGAGTDASVLVEAHHGMHIDAFLDRRCEAERERYLFGRLIRYHGIREDRIELSVIATSDRKSAQEAAVRLDEGADFARIAQRYSQDSSAPAGGRLPPLARSALDAPVADRVFALRPGERTGILITDGKDGRRLFQIFRVNALHPGRPSGYGEVERQVEESLSSRAVTREEWGAWYLAMERLYKVRLSPNL